MIFASLLWPGTESVVPLRSAWIELPGSGTWGVQGGAHCLGHHFPAWGGRATCPGEVALPPLGRDSPLPISEGNLSSVIAIQENVSWFPGLCNASCQELRLQKGVKHSPCQGV